MSKRIWIMLLSWLLLSPAFAAQVDLYVSVPSNTPANAVLSLGGDFNGWDPSHKRFQLTPLKDGRFKFEFKDVEIGKVLNFKVTRGNWDTVEIAESGANRDNRNIQVAQDFQSVDIRVADWADLSNKEAPSTIVGTVVLKDIELPTFPGTRKLRIYLPPGYDSNDERYPVIYMSDGQNVFDSKTANAGEWQMDELMESLAKTGSHLTSIVVAIDHAGENRRMEYLPFHHGGAGWSLLDWNKGRLGKGEAFAHWLVADLKPSIDKQYRTLPDREHTAIMGSSMGGLIACYAALRHQEVFSNAACLSSAFLKRLVANEWLAFIANTPKRLPMRFHIDMGDNEFGLFGDDILIETQEVYDALLNTGFNQSELRYQVIKGGTHDEPSWRARTQDILEWLYTGL